MTTWSIVSPPRMPIRAMYPRPMSGGKARRFIVREGRSHSRTNAGSEGLVALSASMVRPSPDSPSRATRTANGVAIRRRRRTPRPCQPRAALDEWPPVGPVDRLPSLRSGGGRGCRTLPRRTRHPHRPTPGVRHPPERRGHLRGHAGLPARLRCKREDGIDHRAEHHLERRDPLDRDVPPVPLPQRRAEPHLHRLGEHPHQLGRAAAVAGPFPRAPRPPPGDGAALAAQRLLSLLLSL